MGACIVGNGFVVSRCAASEKSFSLLSVGGVDGWIVTEGGRLPFREPDSSSGWLNAPNVICEMAVRNLA